MPIWAVAVVALGASQPMVAANWEATLTRDPRGNFPDLRPARATYVFSWSGITAATADVRFSRGNGDEAFVLEGRGRTVGLARALWRFDVDYRSVADAQGLRPLETHQEENTRGKRVVTDMKFDAAGVVRTRTEPNKPPGTKEFAAGNLHDLFSALLYLRSQPLRDGDVYRLLVYPGSAGYLATLAVAGHEQLHRRSGAHEAIKLDVKLQRVGKKGALEPYRKLKRATAWISDDENRLLLLVEGQIFVGSVTAELQSIRFD